jgi:hypothetical protein
MARLTNLRPSMPAAIHQHMNVCAIDISDHNHRRQTQSCCDVVTGRFDLALVAYLQPCTVPDTFHFQCKNGFVSIDSTIDPNGFNQCLKHIIAFVVLPGQITVHSHSSDLPREVVAGNFA